MVEVLQSGAWGITLFSPKTVASLLFSSVSLLVKLSPFCGGFCVKNIKNLEEQDVNSSLLSLMGDRGVLGFFKLQHCRSCTQTDCTEEMTDLPGCACCSLNVLNVPGHLSGCWGLCGLGASWQKKMEELKSLWAVRDNLTWESRQARTWQ